MNQEKPVNVLKPHWKQVGIFLGLTFGLTYLLNLAVHLVVGFGQNATTTVMLQVQMLIPATVAIVLQLFVFKDSAIYRLKEPPRWVFYFYLAFVLIFVAIAMIVLLTSNTVLQTVANALAQILMLTGLLVIVLVRLASGREAMHRAGLGGGKLWHYLAFGLLLVVLYGGMTALNALFGLGHSVNVRDLLAQSAGGQASELAKVPDLALLLLIGFQSVIVGPILGLLLAFGEEYGWRGYLQGELIKLGKVRGILLLGVIWGLWHAPIIAMGYNYPGYPVLGPILMTLYTIALAFVLGYAVLKTGSVWLAAFLHALNNQVASFLMAVIYAPRDPVWSFGIGLYGLAVWALVVGALLILDRREWKTPAGSAVAATIQSLEEA